MTITKAARNQRTLEGYAARVDGPLYVLALIFLAAWTIWVAVADLPEWAVVTLEVVIVLIWVAVAGDLIFRLVLTPQRWRWAARHPLQVLGVIIPPLYPFKLLTIMTRDTFRAGGRGLLKTGQATVIAAAVLTWTCAVAAVGAERGAPGASIMNFGDAIWWACVTITSVGYGDYVPVTVVGRLVGGVLMFGGLALIGVITATVAAWIISMTSADAGEPKVVPMEESINAALAKAEASKAAEPTPEGADGSPAAR